MITVIDVEKQRVHFLQKSDYDCFVKASSRGTSGKELLTLGKTGGAAK